MRKFFCRILSNIRETLRGSFYLKIMWEVGVHNYYAAKQTKVKTHTQSERARVPEMWITECQGDGRSERNYSFSYGCMCWALWFQSRPGTEWLLAFLP